MERPSWGRRLAQSLSWEPRTYRQVWLAAPLGWGVPGFVVVSVVARHWSSPSTALTYAVSITLVGGLGQSWRLMRRRQQGL
jgi:hypothetical protein